ncbi:MAG: cyclase family protein, partial [Actinomycetes bacterium]
MRPLAGDEAYPAFAELLRREGALAGTSWGLFPDPTRGTPSFITPQAVVEARNCIRSGRVFGLDYPADAFDPGRSLKRGAPRHTIYSSHPAHRDDFLDGYYLQGSSQIDGLRHRRADDV